MFFSLHIGDVVPLEIFKLILFLFTFRSDFHVFLIFGTFQKKFFNYR